MPTVTIWVEFLFGDFKMKQKNVGWLKLHRPLLDKPIWLNSTPEQKTVLITLLMMANHKPKEYEWDKQKYATRPGEVFTSIENIKNNCGKGISTQNVRAALKRFQMLEFLTNEATKGGRLISICNWERYQPPKEDR